MDQNQGVDNDLQKAIDNITSSDPVFSDPVAAPSTIPEGDSGELGDPVGPFPMPPGPEPKVGVVTPGPEPIAPLDPINIPDLGTPGEAQVTPAPKPAMGQVEPITPANPAPMAEANNDEASQKSESVPRPATGGDMHQIKEAALRDLVPLLDHVNTDPAEKFQLCKDIYENLHDNSVLEPAYQAASGITNEDERAKALLYIIESIE